MNNLASILTQFDELFASRFEGQIIMCGRDNDGFQEHSRMKEEIKSFLTQAIREAQEETIKEAIKIIGTHAEGEDLGYCDTGADMENACRSECVKMAISRLNANITKFNK